MEESEDRLMKLSENIQVLNTNNLSFREWAIYNEPGAGFHQSSTTDHRNTLALLSLKVSFSAVIWPKRSNAVERRWLLRALCTPFVTLIVSKARQGDIKTKTPLVHLFLCSLCQVGFLWSAKVWKRFVFEVCYVIKNMCALKHCFIPS